MSNPSWNQFQKCSPLNVIKLEVKSVFYMVTM